MPLPPEENPVEPGSTEPTEPFPEAANRPGGSRADFVDDVPSSAASSLDDITASQELTIPLADLVGRAVAHFQVEERIGSGAMSVVYRAVDERNGDAVALKVLLPGADGVARSRFRQEARTALQLDHPHIIRTHEVGQVDAEGLAYISMELVDGESLAELLERNRQLSIFDSCLILERIARALDFAHGSGIVHRDVKPSNILLRQAADGTPGSVQLSVLDYPVVPILSDFGIARALDAPELTSMGRTVGTPSYMAPEQCSGSHEIDGRADIYALGTVFYRCLVGRPPYVGTTTQVLYAHVYSPLTIPDEVLVNLPMPVIDILRRSLMKEPAGRYATALAMAIDMARITGNVEFQMIVDDVSMSEVTATMTALPATEPTTTSSTILVPSRQTNLSPLVGRRPSGGGSDTESKRRGRSVSEKSRREMNRVAMGFGLALATLLLILVAAVARNEIPDFSTLAQRSDAGSLSVSSTPDAGEVSNRLDDDANEADEEEMSGDGVTVPDVSEIEAPPADPTPAAAPHPAVGVDVAWDEAGFFYQERDWQYTLHRLTFLFRNDEEFNRRLFVDGEPLAELVFELFIDNPESEFLAQNAALFDLPLAESMLFDSLTGLAAQEASDNQIAKAFEYYDAAATLRPDSTDAAVLAASARALVGGFPIDLPDARRDLQQALVHYAALLDEEGKPCYASAQLAGADGVMPDPNLRGEMIRLEALCSSLIYAEGLRGQLFDLAGQLVYSAAPDGRNQIFSMPAQPDAVASLLVDDATQPALSPDGGRLVYYSTAPDSLGLWSVDPGNDPAIRGRHLTEFFEDGYESPAAWNSGGTQIAFPSRREADRKSRIYVSWSDGSDDETIAFGTDPAWRPGLDWIVHNGTDRTSNQPGLWLRRSDGSDAEQLTKIAADQRPAWTPDGQQIVFTSDGRGAGGNRELYRLDINEGIVTRLTDDPAQDVAPAVSPDGGHVAFFSDRGGTWGIWVIEIEGGEPVLLSSLGGDIGDWREHAIQWVK